MLEKPHIKTSTSASTRSRKILVEVEKNIFLKTRRAETQAARDAVEGLEIAGTQRLTLMGAIKISGMSAVDK